jgi:lipoprotein-anchoring transpeptidase ErfK/SrfK
MPTETSRLLACTLLLCAGAVQAQQPDEAAFILQQQQATPLQVLHPNPRHHAQPWIRISLPRQTLVLYDAAGRMQQQYLISSARLGAGEQANSYQTPRGWHQVCEKIGDGASADTIIYHRQITPWHYSAALHASYPQKDWILARILWLCGEEAGKNQGGDVDSHDRAIYIHGAGEHVAFGTPTSRGCIRMQTTDVITLYPQVNLGTDVLIDETH